MSIWSWLFGLIVSLGIGSYATPKFLDWLREGKAEARPDVVPRWITGMLERGFFTVAIAFNVPGSAIAMMAWLGAKMAANWSRQTQDPLVGVSALLSGLLSMFFALIGGLIVRA